MIDIGPTHWFADAKGDIEYPIVRDMDTNMYERQHGSGLEIGSYAHRAILYDPDDLPSVEEASLSPTEFPFTAGGLQPADGAGARADALDRRRRDGRHQARDQRDPVPHARRDADPRRAAGGEGALVGGRRLDQGRAGLGKSLAEWMVHGDSHIDLHSSDSAASGSTRRRPRTSRRERARGSTRPTGSSTRSSSGRRTATSGCRRTTSGRRSSAPSSSKPQAGSGRSGTSRTRPARGVRRPGRAARGRVGHALVVSDHQRRAPRHARSRRDLRPRPRSRSSTSPVPGALDALQAVSMRPGRRAVGRVVYTPRLSPSGGFKSDLTIMRLGDEHFRVVTGGATAGATTSGSPTTCPPTARRSSPTSPPPGRPSVSGARAPATSSRRSRATTSRTRVPVRDLQGDRVGPRADARVPDLLRRRPRLGALRPDRAGRALWDLVWEAGQRARRRALRDRRLRRRPGGSRSATARSAPSSRASTRSSRRTWPGEGEGRRLRRQGGAPPPPRGGTGRDALHADGRRPRSRAGVQRFPMGREPILTRDGAPSSTPRVAART